jgi:hypothetical protein
MLVEQAYRQDRHPDGGAAAAAAAAASVSNRANTAEPDPVMRAVPKRARCSSAAFTPGKRRCTTGCRSLTPTGSPRDSAAEKSAIIVDFVDRVKCGSVKISTV